MVVSFQSFLTILFKKMVFEFFTAFNKNKLKNLHTNVSYFLKKSYGSNVTYLQTIILSAIIFQCVCVTYLTQLLLGNSFRT